MGSYTEENSPESQTFVENPLGDWRKLYPSRHGRGGASVEYSPAATAGSDGRIEAPSRTRHQVAAGNRDHGCRAMRFRQPAHRVRASSRYATGSLGRSRGPLLSWTFQSPRNRADPEHRRRSSSAIPQSRWCIARCCRRGAEYAGALEPRSSTGLPSRDVGSFVGLSPGVARWRPGGISGTTDRRCPPAQTCRERPRIAKTWPGWRRSQGSPCLRPRCGLPAFFPIELGRLASTEAPSPCALHSGLPESYCGDAATGGIVGVEGASTNTPLAVL